MLQVKLFAQARVLTGHSVIDIPWTDGESVLKFKQTLSREQPNLAPLMASLLIAVNNTYARDEMPIRTTDEVACFPPVSGG